jgi:hypothetical protein
VIFHLSHYGQAEVISEQGAEENIWIYDAAARDG